MELDRNEKVTKETYREALFDVIEEAEHSRNFIDNNVTSSRIFDTYVEDVKLAKIRLDCIEKLYQLDNSEE